MSNTPDNEMVGDYSALARYYDAAYNMLTERVGTVLVTHGLLNTFQPGARSIVDLGTGTGAILGGFRGEIDELVGIDSSPEMLAVARDKLPEAELVEADISGFELGREFDAAICLFDTINHLGEFDRWKGLFESTDRHLAADGIFIFDMLTTSFMRRLSAVKDPTTWPIAGGSYTLGVEQAGDNQFVTSFTVRLDEVDGTVETVTGSMSHTTYPVEEVTAAAGEHFELLAAFDVQSNVFPSDGSLPPATNDSKRPFFVYRK